MTIRTPSCAGPGARCSVAAHDAGGELCDNASGERVAHPDGCAGAWSVPRSRHRQPVAVGMSAAGAVTRALLDGGGQRGRDERAVAERLCWACVHGLDVDGASLSLLTATESRVTVAATDPTAQLLEDLQFTLNEGACVEAATTGRPVLVPDLRDTSRIAAWPLFAAEAETRGVAAVFALPLQWGPTNLGVLDLYRMTPGRLDDTQWHDAAAATDTAAMLIVGQRTDPARGPVVRDRHPHSALPDISAEGSGDAGAVCAERDWLDQVAGYRAEIYQAVGMVQVQLGASATGPVSGTDALARLRGHAFAHQQLLIDVARDVVARRLVFSDDDRI